MKGVFLNWPQIAQRSAKIRQKNSNLLQTLVEKLCEQTKTFTFFTKRKYIDTSANEDNSFRNHIR